MMRKRFAVFGVLALVLALLMPSRAFGWDIVGDGTWWRGNTSQGMYGACVHAGNKYDAAAWLFSPGDPAMLSSEIRSKLSDPNYGGRFYEYAQTFTLMEDLTQYPEWLPAYVGVANLFANGFVVGIYDVGFYTSNVSESLYAGAKIDFQRVLAGEDLSGGGSGSPSDSFPAGDYYRIDVVANGNAPIPSKYSFREIYFQVDAYNRLMSQLPSDYRLWFSCFRISDSNRDTTGIFASSNAYISSGHLAWANNANVKGLSSVLVTDDYGVGRQVIYWSDNPSTGNDFPISQSNCSPVYFLIPLDPDSDPVVTLPFGGGDWPEPETPVTPDPPEVPTPTAPTVTPDPEPTQPTPTWPDITINIPGSPTVEVTPTGLDYTELLTRINDNLNTINSYTVSINSGLNSLRSDLVTEFESVEQALRNIYQFLQHMDSMLERHCQHLRDALSDCTHHLELYMKELFEWLPQQLNYDAEFSYDDSAVTSLLRAILNKIPGGSSGIPDTFKPNPQADEPGFFDWLTDLWHRFLIDLVSVLPDEIGGLVDAFSQLTHYFPFSIPWDLAAMLALFEHEPVTPVFDVPWGFGGNEGDVEMVRVDLSPWDGVMQMVRPVFVVGFCWQLALITKDLLAGFDLNKGGV